MFLRHPKPIVFDPYYGIPFGLILGHGDDDLALVVGELEGI